MWLCCLLIVCSGYSQTTSAASEDKYPQYIVLHGDTVGVFSIPQMRHIAQTYYLLDECDSIASALVSERDARRELDAKTDSVIAAYQEIASQDEAVFAAFGKQQVLDKAELASMRREARLAKIKSKVLGWGIGVPVISVVGVGGFILGNVLHLKF